MLSYHMKENMLIIICTIRNELQWNLNQNTKFFFQEDENENIVCKLPAMFAQTSVC